MNKVIIVTGQTAAGKTSSAADLAKRNNGEIVNADSRQVYKKLDIITGKDHPKNIRVWLYDIVDPKEYFSSYDYVRKALPLIKKLLENGKTPVIVGGSYLYLKHLLYDVETENIPPDWQLRKRLENKPITELQAILTAINNTTIQQLNNSELNNPQRLIRKIEIAKAVQPTRLYRHEFNTITLGDKLHIKNLNLRFIGLRFKDKEKLREKISQRVEKRLKNGAIDEVKKLLAEGYTENDPGLKTIGYQQIIKYLKGEITKDEAVKQWTFKEIQYAKRQYTFMKKDSNIVWKEI